ncbi:MAG: hypothetical protein V1809_15955 [Planctomycetota bacterium]
MVRHVVAGMMGEKPPRPLKPGLIQELEWDGRRESPRGSTCKEGAMGYNTFRSSRRCGSCRVIQEIPV